MLCGCVTFSNQLIGWSSLHEGLCAKLSSACRGRDWKVVNPDLSHCPRTRVNDNLCVQLQHGVKSPLCCESKQNIQLLHRWPASGSTPAVCHTVFFTWPGHKNQSADYKLCRSMCSSVREAQCFSLDLALAKLALLQSPLRTRLCSKGAAELLWLHGGRGRQELLFVIYLLNAVWLLLYLPEQHSQHSTRLKL